MHVKDVPRGCTCREGCPAGAAYDEGEHVEREVLFVIHLYQNNGYNIVLDVNSGAVHVVDKAAYDVIGALEEQNEFHTPETLKSPETAAY